MRPGYETLDHIGRGELRGDHALLAARIDAEIAARRPDLAGALAAGQQPAARELRQARRQAAYYGSQHNGPSAADREYRRRELELLRLATP